MQVRLRASTGAKILVWRQDDTYHVRLADGSGDPRISLEMDLFELIAELAGLDLEEGAQALEAMTLAEDAQRRLGVGSGDAGGAGGGPSLRLQGRG